MHDNMIELKTKKDSVPKVFGKVQFISQYDCGKTEILQESNLSLNNLYAHIIDCLRDGQFVANRIDLISVGKGGHSAGDIYTPIPPQASDIALDDEIDPPGKKQIVTRASATAYEVEFNTTFFKDEANEQITEAGLFLDNGTIVNRVTFPAFEKSNLVTMLVRWFLYFNIT